MTRNGAKIRLRHIQGMHMSSWSGMQHSMQQTVVDITANLYACYHGQEENTDVMSKTGHALCATSMQDQA